MDEATDHWQKWWSCVLIDRANRMHPIIIPGRLLKVDKCRWTTPGSTRVPASSRAGTLDF
jgi:hypothetical protein